MTKKQYRKRRLANKYAKENKISVARAFLILNAQEKIATALGRLPRHKAVKVLKCVSILMDIKL